MNKDMKILRLTANQRFRLFQWCESNFDRITEEKLTKLAFSKMAAKDLGFEIHQSHIASAVVGIGREWPRGRGTGSNSDQSAQQALVELTARQAVLISRELGISIPEELEAVAGVSE